MFSGQKDVEVVKHGVESILKINYLQRQEFPSLEDSPVVMRDTIKKIIQNPSITKVVLMHNKNYEYNYSQVQYLKEVGEIHTKLSKQKELFSTTQIANKSDECMKIFFNRYAFLQNAIIKDLLGDPIGTYVKLKRKKRDYKFETNYHENQCIEVDNNYENALEYIISQLENTSLIKPLTSSLSGHKVGERNIYQQFFSPNIKPNFIYTSLLKQIPRKARELDSYSLKSGNVTVYELENEANNLYHLLPLEFSLSEEKYSVLSLAKEVISEHKPESNDFIDPSRLREVFFNIAKDLVEEIAEFKNVRFKQEEIDELANILIRYTVGFGLIETLLEDEKVQDISINAPANKTPIFLSHADFEDCKTNIIPEQEEVESWASKLRLISGKPLDASNPILDAEIETPEARARVSIIGKPLNPYGFGLSFRRHRDKPWTLPLFVKNNMISIEAAGLLSFIVDGARTMLIAGTRGSGKSSFLTAMMIEIMRKYRMITIEDSVTGDSQIIIKNKNETQNIKIEELFENISKEKKIITKNNREIIENPNFKVYSINKNGKIKKSKASKILRHKVNKQIFEITTATGRSLKVTQDHSLFTIGENIPFKEIKTKDIRLDSYIVTPKKIPGFGKHKKTLNINSKLKKSTNENIFVKIKSLNEEELKKKAKKENIPKPTINTWIKTKTLPIKFAKEKEISHFKISKNSQKFINSKIELDQDLLTFIGLLVADGCYDKNSTIISVNSKEEKELVKKISKKFSFETKTHSDKFSIMINSKSFKFLLYDLFELNGDAYSKKIPNWIFSLSTKQKSWFLKGLFSGDGCVGKYEVIISLASKQLLKDIQTLLLEFEIISRIRFENKQNKIYPDRTSDLRISSLKNTKEFEKKINFLQQYKQEKLKIITNRKSTHENTNIIPLPNKILNEISKITPDKIFNSNDYIKKENKIGKEKLKSILKFLKNEKPQELKLISYLDEINKSDIFWDKVISIKEINNEQYVYDISVPGDENFICENILAHNTLEIPGLQFADLGFNIQSMSVRSALSISKEGFSADMGIRSTLRLGDSCLIVGEVRSTEALALYEAMRVGALANVVAGTIHGDSPYGVYDRLVNDLGVPKTSFKATDIIIVANPVKSSDGLHRNRRITAITEIRKNWENDPEIEGGFMDLFKYNSQTDRLEITDDLLNGESDILKAIGSNVKQWAGNWDAIWKNVELRSQIKQLQIDYAEKFNMPEMLEAKPVIECNDMFHKISEKVNAQHGSLDNDKILFEFEQWLKRFYQKENNSQKA